MMLLDPNGRDIGEAPDAIERAARRDPGARHFAITWGVRENPDDARVFGWAKGWWRVQVTFDRAI